MLLKEAGAPAPKGEIKGRGWEMPSGAALDPRDRDEEMSIAPTVMYGPGREEAWEQPDWEGLDTPWRGDEGARGAAGTGTRTEPTALDSPNSQDKIWEIVELEAQCQGKALTVSFVRDEGV